MIGLSPSTYYYNPKVSREERERQDADLRGKIEDIQAEIPESGYRSVECYLKRKGLQVGERRIRRVMKKYSLHAKLKRAFQVTTDSNHEHRVVSQSRGGNAADGHE